MAVRDATRARGLPLAGGPVHRRPGGRGRRPGIDVVCELIGGVEPARGPAAPRAREREVRRHREQGAPGRARGGAVRGRRRGGRRPVLRGRRRGRDPADPSAPRVAGGGARRPRPRHRERDDQLHPHADVRARLDVGTRPWPRRSGSGSPRRIRRPTSRATTRRRSARSSPRWRSGRGSSPATSTERDLGGHPQDFADADRLGYAIKLLAIAELDEDEVSVRVHPSMIPADHPSGRRSRRVERGVRRGTEDRPADVLRRGRGWRSHRDRRRR